MLKLARIPAKAILVSLVLMTLLSSGIVPVARAQESVPPALFTQVAAPADAGQLEPEEVRSAYVKVDLGLLFDANGKARDERTLPEIGLNLFPDVKYTGIVTKIKKSSTSTTWIGTLKGKQLSYFYLIESNNIFIAHVASLEGIYEISWANENLYKVIQIDQSRLDKDFVVEADSPSFLDFYSNILPNGGGVPPKIDVLVVYTSKARSKEGGADQMKARIELAMEETNDSYAKSGIITRLRLVHAQEITFNETGYLETDLGLLIGPSDGFLDDVHQIRKYYGADMVSLIVEAGDYCGLAPVFPKAEKSFQVTRRNCMTGSYSFGHEFGHLQGAHHDVYAIEKHPEQGQAVFSYGHGYVYLGPLSGWRTMMATSDLCNDKKGLLYKCTRMLYWSNPSVKIGGRPVGVVGESENTRVLTETAWNISSHLKYQVSDDFFSDFGIRYGGWSAVSGNWKIANGTYSTGTDGYFNSVKHMGKHVDFKYEAMLKRTVARYNANNIIIRGDTSSLSGAKEWKSEYAFQYSNDGTFSVWKTDSNGTKTPLQPWTVHSIIRPYNWNKLTVHAIGNRFTFLINNTPVWTGTDSSLTGGEVGIGRWDIESRPNEFLINWAELTNYIYTDVMADSLADQEIVPGVELSGGTIDSSPHR